MKRMSLLVTAAVLVFCVAGYVRAEDAAAKVSGKPGCGGCTGVVESCSVMLTDKDGMRWILTGDSESLKTAFKARHEDKLMTATLSGKPVVKKDKAGKEFKEVKVTEVAIASK